MCGRGGWIDQVKKNKKKREKLSNAGRLSKRDGGGFVPTIKAAYTPRLYSLEERAPRTPSPYCLFNFRHLPSQQHTMLLCHEHTAARLGNAANGRRRCILEFCSATRQCRWSGRERDNKMKKTSGNGRKRQEEERLGIAA